MNTRCYHLLTCALGRGRSSCRSRWHGPRSSRWQRRTAISCWLRLANLQWRTLQTDGSIVAIWQRIRCCRRRRVLSKLAVSPTPQAGKNSFTQRFYNYIVKQLNVLNTTCQFLSSSQQQSSNKLTRLLDGCIAKACHSRCYHRTASHTTCVSYASIFCTVQ